MRPITVPNLVALAASQVLALVATGASTWAVWLWLVSAHPFR